MARNVSLQDAIAHWKSGVASKQANYTKGVGSSKDWAAAATTPQAIQARNQGLQAAMTNGTIEAGINRLGTGRWQAQTIAKAANWQNGVNSPQAQQNAQAGFTRLYGYLSTAQSAIAGTPRGGINENIARMTAFVQSMHASAQADKQAGRG